MSGDERNRIIDTVDECQRAVKVLEFLSRVEYPQDLSGLGILLFAMAQQIDQSTTSLLGLVRS